MSWTYRCPHCHGMLNPENAIILIAKHRGRTFLAGFHPRPGNYEVYLPPGNEVLAGEVWSFLCPVCRQDLVTDFAKFLCAIDIHTDEESHRVFFSRIAGDQATFIVSSEGILEHHGRDVEKYSAELAQMKYLL